MKKLFLIVFLNLFILSGCSESGDSRKNASADIFAMDTYISIKAYGKNSETAVRESCEEIKRLEKLFSVTDSGSDIYKINNCKASDVSDDTVNIIKKSLEIGKLTDGYLDITVYPVLKLWGFTTRNYRIPKQNEIDSLLENVDFKKVKISGNTISVPKGCELDLGAVAKGYASDRISEIFKENGIQSGAVNLGGNVYVSGMNPDGELWKVGIRNPFSSDENIGILSVSDKSVITSGNYERFFTGSDGKNYCHIIDPATGYPADNGLVSVTVTGNSGIICDSLSTALFVMGEEKSEEYWRNNPDFGMILIDSNKKIHVTDNINFKNTSDMELEIINIEQKN